MEPSVMDLTVRRVADAVLTVACAPAYLSC